MSSLKNMVRNLQTAKMSETETSFVKATWDDDQPCKKKHVVKLISTSRDDGSRYGIEPPNWIKMIEGRMGHKTWNVRVKTLTLCHRLMDEGGGRFSGLLARQPSVLSMPTLSRDNRNVDTLRYYEFGRHYSNYLQERLFVFRGIRFALEKHKVMAWKDFLAKRVNSWSAGCKALRATLAQLSLVPKLVPHVKSRDGQTLNIDFRQGLESRETDSDDMKYGGSSGGYVLPTRRRSQFGRGGGGRGGGRGSRIPVTHPVEISALMMVLQDSVKVYSFVNLLLLKILDHLTSIRSQLLTRILAQHCLRFAAISKELAAWCKGLQDIRLVPRDNAPDFNCQRMCQRLDGLLREQFQNLNGKVEIDEDDRNSKWWGSTEKDIAVPSTDSDEFKKYWGPMKGPPVPNKGGSSSEKKQPKSSDDSSEVMSLKDMMGDSPGKPSGGGGGGGSGGGDSEDEDVDALFSNLAIRSSSKGSSKKDTSSHSKSGSGKSSGSTSSKPKKEDDLDFFFDAVPASTTKKASSAPKKSDPESLFDDLF